MLANFNVEQTGAGTYVAAIKLNSPDQLRLLLEFIVENSTQALPIPISATPQCTPDALCDDCAPQQ